MPEVVAILAQFGPAGLIGLLWITERRHAAARERRLVEAHRKIVQKDHTLSAVLNVVKDNTRALASLDHTQRRLVELISTRLATSKRLNV